MYLLDTNVLSELRKVLTGRADPRVTAWAKGIGAEATFLSVVTIMEIETGILRLERYDEAQASKLRSWLLDSVLPDFREKILGVDLAVARQAARLHVPHPRPADDMLIAATAMVHGLTLVTRNLGDFQDIELRVINPWSG